MKKDNDKAKKYKRKAWKSLRKSILARDEYICQYYKRFGKVISADTVHHIYPAEQYPELFYNPNNLISLSNKAHNIMHNRDTDEITDIGLSLQKKYKRLIFDNDDHKL